MDWANVTPLELVDALREVEWSTPPRPLAEFFQKFTPPKNASKWQSRVKCNIYYYRTNYLFIIFLILFFSFLRKPTALLAAITSILAVSCLNDSFALALSERLTRSIRRLSPPLAAKLRAPAVRTGVRGRPLRGQVYICGQDRRIVVALLMLVSTYLWYVRRGVYTVLFSLIISTGVIALHATFRSPNLKARLNSFREEFRAVWRGYTDAP